MIRLSRLEILRVAVAAQQLNGVGCEAHRYIPDECPCWHCEQPTKWVDLAFEVPLCPGWCTDAMWCEFGG